MTDNSTSNQMIPITEKMIAKAHKSLSAEIHERCPRCNSDKWNESGSDPNRIVTHVRVDGVHSGGLAYSDDGSGAFYIDCGNCGFLEHFLWRPVLDFVLKNRG